MCEPTKQLQNIDQYFVKRNAISINPLDKINYLENALAIMNTGNHNDKLADSINSLSNNIIEINPGIGGLSMALLDWFKTKQLIMYENNKIYQSILRNNLEQYKFPSNNYQILDNFNTVPNNIRDIILVINLHKDCVDKPFEYITTLKKNRYKIKYAFIIGLSEDKFTENIDGYTSQIKKTETINIQTCVPIKMEKKELDINDISEIKPEYESKIFYTSPQRWRDELKKFIYKTLQLILTNTQILNMLTSNMAMDIWVRAFTSDYWDPDPTKNYQILEYYGDSVMKETFDGFLLKQNPDLDEAQATQLRITYVSKIVQNNISKKLGLPRYMRTPTTISTSVAEDLLEAFYGALMTVGDTVFKQGMGYGLAYNLTKYIYTNIYPIDTSKSSDPNKTQVKNIFNKLEWGKDTQDFINEEQYNDQWTFTLLWPPNAKPLLQSKNIRSEILVTTKGHRTVKAAESKLYKLAIDRLNQLGITLEYANSQQKKSKKKDNQYQELYDQAADGVYTDLKFEFIMGYMGKKYIQLQGTLPDDTIISLITLPIDDSIKFTKNHMLEQYWKIYILAYYIKYGKQEYPQ